MCNIPYALNSISLFFTSTQNLASFPQLEKESLDYGGHVRVRRIVNFCASWRLNFRMPRPAWVVIRTVLATCRRGQAENRHSSLSIAQSLATAVRETLIHDRFNLNPSRVFMLANYSDEDVLHLDEFMTLHLLNINSSGKGTQDNAASYNSNIEADFQRIIK